MQATMTQSSSTFETGVLPSGGQFISTTLHEPDATAFWTQERIAAARPADIVLDVSASAAVSDHTCLASFLDLAPIGF